MKSLKESILSESRSILDQPDWDEVGDIKYISKAANRLEKISSHELANILKIQKTQLPEAFSVYGAMVHCVQDVIDACTENNALSDEVQDELGTFAVFNDFKSTYHYLKVSDNYYNDYNGDVDKYIKMICDKWDDICKKATGNYWW